MARISLKRFGALCGAVLTLSARIIANRAANRASGSLRRLERLLSGCYETNSTSLVLFSS
jgi:hypothetical protein